MQACFLIFFLSSASAFVATKHGALASDERKLQDVRLRIENIKQHLAGKNLENIQVSLASKVEECILLDQATKKWCISHFGDEGRKNSKNFRMARDGAFKKGKYTEYLKKGLSSLEDSTEEDFSTYTLNKAAKDRGYGSKRRRSHGLEEESRFLAEDKPSHRSRHRSKKHSKASNKFEDASSADASDYYTQKKSRKRSSRRPSSSKEEESNDRSSTDA
ncbi:hypothetical protein NECID01_0238 [Nematocida sp. AWRm77]|nr:hypothetical protein NECID01_0238 [Nematocida sp. AWRm77]